MHPKKERTFVILKPDTIQRGLMGEVLKRFEKIGLKIVAMKMINATAEQTREHYNKDDIWCTAKGQRLIDNLKSKNLAIKKEAVEYGRDIIRALTKYMLASPVVILVVEGNEAMNVVKRLVGGTEPMTADTGTIRGDYAIDSYNICDIDSRSIRNLIHCTDPVDGKSEYEREVKVWFDENEILNYKLVSEVMLYDVNLDGLME